jgi:hypothetical protein
MKLQIDLSDEVKATLDRSKALREIIQRLDHFSMETKSAHERAYLNAALDNCRAAHSTVKECTLTEINKEITMLL